MVLVIKILAIAAVGGVAFVFMRPHVPILPPALIGKKRRKVAVAEHDDMQEIAHDIDRTTETAAQAKEPSQAPQPPQAPPPVHSTPASPGSPKKEAHTLYMVTENELVVHELLLQGDEALHTVKDLSPEQLADLDPRAALSMGVAEVAERAFWDALGDGLRAAPPQWERLVVLLGEARDSLAALIPPGSPEGAGLLSGLAEKLDTGYMRQRLGAGYDPAYLRQLFDFLVHAIASLEAPARSESTKQGYAEIVKSFAAATAPPLSKDSPKRRVRVSLETRSSTEVPVSVTTREAWLPVDVRPGGESSPKRGAGSGPLTQHAAAGASPGGASDAPSEDWVHMGSAEEAARHPPRTPSPGVQFGAPLEEEEVEVRFGMPVDRDRVSVQLLASPSRAATPAPPAAAAGAPSAGPDTAAILAAAARFVLNKIAELRADLAKARLEMLKGILQGSSSGVQYERRRITAAVGDRHPAEALPRTAAWLASGLQKVAPSGAKVNAGMLRAITAEALLLLIQRPSAISTAGDCPEALLLDAQRLVAAQNELQRLALVGAALLVAQMLLGAKGLPAQPHAPANHAYFAEVKDAFAALLAKADVRMPHLTAALSGILARRLGQDTASVDEDSNLASRLLMRIFSVDDVIYKKVQGGVVDALRVLLADPAAAQRTDAVASKLRLVGAELILQEVTSAARMLDRILSLNLAVCGPFYEAILRQLQAGAGQASA